MRGLLKVFIFLPFAVFGSNDSIPEGKNSRFLVVPFIVRSPETSWGFGSAGAYFFKTKKKEDSIRTSDINLVGLYTLRKQTVIVLGSTVFFPREKAIFRFQSSYSYYPDYFWGLGNDSPDDAKEEYTLKQFFFNPQVIFRVYDQFYLGLNFEMQDVTDFAYGVEGSLFDLQQVEGRKGGFTSGAGILVTWDTRNNSYSPGKGSFAELNVTRFSDFLGSDFEFTSYMVDVRKFFPLGRNRVLGTQAYSRINNGDIPIRYLAMLGGNEIMRGYYKGRYADQSMIAMQAEIRQHLFWRLGVVAFGSVGQVSSRVRNFGIGDFHAAGGGGLRIRLNEKEKLNLRVDVGFGENSLGVYVMMREAF